MQRGKIFGFSVLALALVVGGADHFHHQASRTISMSALDPNKVELKPAPIRKEWVLEGTPTTMAGEIAHTDDNSMQAFVWRTTASKFNWFYEFDEIVHVLDGDVYISDGDGKERHLGPGDVAFFPLGAKTTWRVPDHLRKIAVLQRPLPGPVASGMRWLRTVKHWVKPAPALAAN